MSEDLRSSYDAWRFRREVEWLGSLAYIWGGRSPQYMKAAKIFKRFNEIQGIRPTRADLMPLWPIEYRNYRHDGVDHPCTCGYLCVGAHPVVPEPRQSRARHD